MLPGRAYARGRTLGLVIGLGGLALCLACADPQAPPGGPMDRTPPWLMAASPDSDQVALRDLQTLRFTFSEKMDRQDAFRWLSLYPRITAQKTSWHGAREATVTLETPLPSDTVVVFELMPSLKDAHGVPLVHGRTWAVATADSLPVGVITGSLVKDNKPLADGVIELFSVPPESLRYFQQPLLRRAVTDSAGTFRFPWLPVPGGPYLVRAFADANHDRRPADNEAQRLLPDTVRVTVAAPSIDLGVTAVYDPNAPGQLRGRLAGRPAWPGSVLAFVLKIADSDTGWAPGPVARGGTPAAVVPDTGVVEIPRAGPGLVRAVFFVDVDADSALSAMPAVPGDTLGAWVLEPWALVDSLTVEPGLTTRFPSPVWPDTLTPWASPLAVAADSLAAQPDSTAAAPLPDGGER